MNHTSLKILAVSFTVTVLLFSSGTTLAWHWEEEHEYERYQTLAGDPRVQDEAQHCLNETEGLQEVGCSVFSWNIIDSLNFNPLNTQRVPDCATARTFGSSNPEIRIGFTWQHQEYSEESCEEGGPAVAAMPIWTNVSVSTASKIMGHTHLRADPSHNPFLGGSQADDPSLGVLPCLTVRMEMRTNLPDRRVFAQGESTKSVVTPGAPAGPMDDPCPESTGTTSAQNVTRFDIDLGAAETPIPLWRAPLLTIQVEPWDPMNPQEIIPSPNLWSIVSGPEHQNRIVFPVEGALEVQEVNVRVDEGESRLRIKIQSAWGSTDVDPKNVQIRLFDERQQELPLRHLEEAVIYEPFRDDPRRVGPVEVTYPWDYREENLGPGDYTLNVTATNWQHTMDASRHLNFTLDEDNDLQVHSPDSGPSADGAPGTPLGQLALPYGVAGLVFLLVALVLSVAWLRRHRW